jgi:hypothetical protein
MKNLQVGMVGYAFMGGACSQARSQVRKSEGSLRSASAAVAYRCAPAGSPIPTTLRPPGGPEHAGCSATRLWVPNNPARGIAPGLAGLRLAAAL